jgi:ABC-type nitrate/sulfonate/bicarbonate transport system substrate-binding protein
MSRNLACVNNRYAALQTEQVDGAILAEPVSLIGQEKGLVNLGDAYKLVPGYQLAGVWIKEEWAKKNRDLTWGFVRAFHNALVWLHDNRSEALELLPKITTLSKQYVQTSWETYTKAQIWPRDGKVNPKGLQLVIDLMAEEGQLEEALSEARRRDRSQLFTGSHGTLTARYRSFGFRS